MKHTLLALSLLALITLPSIATADGLKPVTILEYHAFPPMVVSESRRSGLTFGFTRLLNRDTDQFEFDVELQSLPNTLARLQDGEPAVVLFVSPIWFDDVERSKYLWTQPVYQLRDEVVSRQQDAFEYQGPESLSGLTVAGIEGYTYVGLDSMVERGLATRINYANDKAVLDALVNDDRIDVAIVNSGPLSFYTNIMNLSDAIHISEIPQGEYPVRILVSRNLPRVFEYIEYKVETLSDNKMWQDMRRLYLMK